MTKSWHDSVLEKLDEAPQGVHLYHSPVEIFAFRSESDPMRVHYVVADWNMEFIFCTCDGFRYTDYCWHVEKVRNGNAG